MVKYLFKKINFEGVKNSLTSNDSNKIYHAEDIVVALNLFDKILQVY